MIPRQWKRLTERILERIQGAKKERPPRTKIMPHPPSPAHIESNKRSLAVGRFRLFPPTTQKNSPFIPNAVSLPLDASRNLTEPPRVGRWLSQYDRRSRKTRHSGHVHLRRFGNSDGIPFHPSALNQQGPKQQR